MSKLVSVRKSNRIVNKLSQSEMETRSRDELVRLVGRLYRQGLNAEDIKEWFVHGIPNALTVVANRGRLPRRRSRVHNVAVPPGTTL